MYGKNFCWSAQINDQGLAPLLTGPGLRYVCMSKIFDVTSAPLEEAIDGLKVDVTGNVYVSGPGGMWILSPAGKSLGTVTASRPRHNFAWHGKTLYLTASDKLYRMPHFTYLKVLG